MEFDKNRFIDNVYELARRSRLDIEALETECGVPAGYLSRLRHGKEDAAPRADLLLAISGLFSVSIDTLLSYDFTRDLPTEELLLRFLEKLIRDTRTQKICWMEDFWAYPESTPRNPDGTILHPLLLSGPSEDGKDPEPVYRSMFHQNLMDLIPVKVYAASITEMKTLYLVQVWNTGDNPDSPGDWTELELVMDIGAKHPIAFAHTDHDQSLPLNSVLQHLFDDVEEMNAYPHLTQDAITLITNYLNDEYSDQ